jgi:hypothetical protein
MSMHPHFAYKSTNPVDKKESTFIAFLSIKSCTFFPFSSSPSCAQAESVEIKAKLSGLIFKSTIKSNKVNSLLTIISLHIINIHHLTYVTNFCIYVFRDESIISVGNDKFFFVTLNYFNKKSINKNFKIKIFLNKIKINAKKLLNINTKRI